MEPKDLVFIHDHYNELENLRDYLSEIVIVFREQSNENKDELFNISLTMLLSNLTRQLKNLHKFQHKINEDFQKR